MTMSSVISTLSMVPFIIPGLMGGIGPCGSFVKTEENWSTRTSAFSLSDDVVMSPLFRLETPSLVLTCDFAKFQNFLGFVLASPAIDFSWFILEFLVIFRT